MSYDSVCAGCITYGPSGNEDPVLGPPGLEASFQRHISDTLLWVQVGAGAGGASPMFARVKVGNQVSAVSPLVSFSFAKPVCTYMSPSTGDTFSLDFAPQIIDMYVTNVPFLDPSAKLVVCFGSCTGATAQVLTPADLPATVTGVYNLMNADGSYNITFALPLFFSGGYVPVSLAQERGSVFTTILPATPLTTFTYNPPEISSVVVTPVNWQTTNPNCSICGITGYDYVGSAINSYGPNPNALCADAAQQALCSISGPVNAPAPVFCPLPAAGVPGYLNSVWNCANAANIYKVVVIGKNFRTSARELNPFYNPLNDGVTPYVEIFNAGQVNRTGNVTSIIGEWEPVEIGGFPVELGGLRTGANYAQGCPYFPTYGCTYRASNSTFQYTSAWGNYRIELYTTLRQGTVRVRLVSVNASACAGPPVLTGPACCDPTTGKGKGCVTQVDSMPFNTLSSSVGMITGALTGLNSAGYGPNIMADPSPGLLTMLLDQMQFAKGLEVRIGDGVSMPVTPCRLVIADNAGTTFRAYTNNPVADILAPQGCPNCPEFVSVSCVIPPGQGANQPVQVHRTMADGSIDATDRLFTVSYSPPTITDVRSFSGSVQKWSSLDSRNLYGWDAVLSPTLNGVIRIIGTSLGTNPTVTVNTPGFRPITRANGLKECLGTNNTHTCYEFTMPPGEGDGGGNWRLTVRVTEQARASARAESDLTRIRTDA